MTKIGIINLGCPKNLVDAEIMLGLLEQNNCTIVHNVQSADIVIVNTCGFIESAKQESIDAIFSAVNLKESKNCKVIVSGCLAQRYSNELSKEIPEVDAIFGISDLSKIVDVVRTISNRQLAVGNEQEESKKVRKQESKKNSKLLTLNSKLNAVEPFDRLKFYTSSRKRLTPKHLAYIKIADGCDNKCTYCAIPNIRKSFISREFDDIIKEAKVLAKDGVKEINLIAQDTTLYGIDLYKKQRLSELLNALSEIHCIEWIRLLYTHPAHYTDELINTIAKNKKICKYLDLPLQHISDKILKMMNRKVTSKDIKELIAKLRNSIPNLTLRTSFIVGFPGETDKDFNQLLSFVEEIEFERLGAFMYSEEEGTPAVSFKNKVSKRIMQDRYEQLMELQQNIAFRKNESLIGKSLKVLIDNKSENAEYKYEGRTEFDAYEIDQIVYINNDNLKIGSFVDVKIVNVDGYDLVGELI